MLSLDTNDYVHISWGFEDEELFPSMYVFLKYSSDTIWAIRVGYELKNEPSRLHGSLAVNCHCPCKVDFKPVPHIFKKAFIKYVHIVPPIFLT
jgi:hypothetical protein